METDPRTRVLVAESNEPVRKAITSALIEAGYAVVEASDGLSALSVLAWVPIDVVLLDVTDPSYNGLFVLRHLEPVPPVLVVHSAFTFESPASVREEVGCGVFRAVQKPVTPEDLVDVIDDAVQELTGTLALS